MRRLVPFTVLLALLVAACSQGQSAQPAQSPTSTTGTDGTGGNTPKTTQAPKGDDPATTTTRRRRQTPSNPQEVVNQAIESVEDYWGANMRDVYGIDYEPLEGGHTAYDENSDIPACGGPPPSYREFRGNAFYCPLGDFIAYDIGYLIPRELKEGGPFAVAFVLAHEWGHAIQTRGGVSRNKPTIVRENQADCFAGAWARHVQDGNDRDFQPQTGDLESGMAAMLRVRDPIGTDPTEPGAHGSAFDRVNSFQEGFEQGPQRCREYGEGNPPKPVTMPFQTREDAARGGNYPYDPFRRDGQEQPGAAELAARDLNEFFSSRLEEAGLSFGDAPELRPYRVGEDNPTCGRNQLSDEEATENVFYCRDGNFIAYDDELMRAVYDGIGDFGVATVLAQQYGVAAQLHSDIDHEQVDAQLQQSCLAGAWTGSVARQDRVERNPDGTVSSGLSLSPGDLDETVQSFLAFNRSAEDANLNAFARVSAFRKGFQSGESACRLSDQ